METRGADIEGVSTAPKHPLCGLGVGGETRQYQVLLDVLRATHSYQDGADSRQRAHELYGALHVAGMGCEGFLDPWGQSSEDPSLQ